MGNKNAKKKKDATQLLDVRELKKKHYTFKFVFFLIILGRNQVSSSKHQIFPRGNFQMARRIP